MSVIALAIDPVHGRRHGEAARPPTLTHPPTLYAVIGADPFHGGGLFQSTDGAASWNAVNSGLPNSLYIEAVAVDPQNPNTLYVGGNTGAFRSTDGAASWTRAGNLSNAWNLAVDPLDSGSVYAVNDVGILKGTDGGGSWNVVSPQGTASDPFQSLVGWVVVAPGEGGPSTVYVGGNARGVFKSLDGGSTWTWAKSGLFATSIYSLAIDPQNPHTVYAGDRTGLYKSPDGAVSWSATPILPEVSVYALANDPHEQGTVYAGCCQNGLYKSIDGGASWVQLQVAAGFADLANPIFPLAVDTRNPGTVYAGDFKSTDGGASWAKLAVGPTALAIDPQDSDTLYAGTIEAIAGELSVLLVSSGVRKSVDGGRSWSVANTVSQSYGVFELDCGPGQFQRRVRADRIAGLLRVIRLLRLLGPDREGSRIVQERRRRSNLGEAGSARRSVRFPAPWSRPPEQALCMGYGGISEEHGFRRHLECAANCRTVVCSKCAGVRPAELEPSVCRDRRRRRV